tara:strand:+ start:2096 stop:3166 length:1071 start_codon:yes stop_codon:yes gene_type:complete
VVAKKLVALINNQLFYMKSSRLFSKLAKIALLFTYLIVLAGGFVRMTGSGMGCPDWPKCFGLFIPPTSESEITWGETTQYNASQMLIHNDTLWVAKNNFISKKNFNRKNWDSYKKHNYAKFNVFHTWAEYINRCIGAITGIFVLGLFCLSVFTRNSLYEFTGSLILLILFGLQAWLGGEVVFSVLNPFKITIHMFVALIIVCVLFILIHITNNLDFQKTFNKSKKIKFLLILTLLFSLIQIFFGTQVREYVDALPSDKSIWSSQIQYSTIKIHQFIAVGVLITNIFLCVSIAGKYQFFKEAPKEVFLILITLIFLVFSGIVMMSFNFPGLAQLIHLFSAFILFGSQFNLFLKINFS